MSYNAPGQFLGYVLQVPRALFHLLAGGPGDVVCVEVHGDVSSLEEDDKIKTEEDKSSVNSNPLTNKSTDLWKTFHNWIVALKNDELKIKSTSFILYTNKAGRPGIVNKFDSAKTKEEAQNAIDKAKDLLKEIKPDHEIWEYYNYVMNENEEQLVEVIQKFDLQVGSSSGFKEVDKELVKKHIDSKLVDSIRNSLLGWILDQLTHRIANKQLAKITWEDFDKYIKVTFHRLRSNDLLDFTLIEPITEEEIEGQLKIKPFYLKQLDAIELDSDDNIKAVSDFLRAKVNREKWIESGIMDEYVAREFQEKLCDFWGNEKKRIEITELSKDVKDKGKLLYLGCMQRQQMIRDVDPPAATISGTYHALADEPVLGWHLDWEDLFLKNKDN